MSTRRWRPVLLTLSALALGVTATAHAEPVPEWMKSLAKDPADPRTKGERELRRKQYQFEKELRKLRAKYFRSEHRPTREEGLKALSAYTESWMIRPLIEVFQEEKGADLQETLVGMFRASATDEGDRALMWLAVSNRDSSWQVAATETLKGRLADLKQSPSAGMLAVLQAAIMSKDQWMADSAALASGVLGLYEMIPFMIQAQTAPPPATSPIGRPRNGPLAWIAIAKQTAYVADLVPLVADNAVVFDTVPGVVNSGVVLVINDAAVSFSPVVINTALVDLSDRIAGQPTKSYGVNPKPWVDWYKTVGEAAIAKAVEKRIADAESAKPAVKPPAAPAGASVATPAANP